MMSKRQMGVYGVLACAWLALSLWQMMEHQRVVVSAKTALMNRARDISHSLSAVIRAQSWFGRVRQPRLERSLEGLAQSQEMVSVALLNASRQIVASAGNPLPIDINALPDSGVQWRREDVILINPIDLGVELDDEGSTQSTPIIISPDDDDDRSARTRVRRGPPPPIRRTVELTSSSLTVTLTLARDFLTTQPGQLASLTPLSQRLDSTSESVVFRMEFPRSQTPPPDGVEAPAPMPLTPPPPPDEDGRLRRRSPRPFGRPPWMTDAEYQDLLEKQGLHGFVLVMSAARKNMEVARDLQARLAIIGIALIAALGVGMAWRNLERSSQLQLRLVRASELNTHLREMNVAAAGLAHETRNPLNIVRGLAQMISQQEEPWPRIQQHAQAIIEEVDRVTGRLNEFIDYSRPREPRPTPTVLGAVAREVQRALETDREEKQVEFRNEGPELTIAADEPMLRQVFFNLLLNAIQAVPHGGRVTVVTETVSPDEAAFEVRDNGPGVPVTAREDIFRPYVTMRADGAGLGLAIVRQIALAHGWDIQYVPSEDGGARFRVSGLKIVSKA